MAAIYSIKKHKIDIFKYLTTIPGESSGTVKVTFWLVLTDKKLPGFCTYHFQYVNYHHLYWHKCLCVQVYIISNLFLILNKSLCARVIAITYTFKVIAKLFFCPWKCSHLGKRENLGLSVWLRLYRFHFIQMLNFTQKIRFSAIRDWIKCKSGRKKYNNLCLVEKIQ